MKQTEEYFQPTQAMADKMGELVVWAVLNTSEHFTCKIEFTAHVQWMRYGICKDGWSTSTAQAMSGELHIKHNSEESFCLRVDELLEDFRSLKQESDKKWSEENQVVENEKIRIARIEHLRDRLSELEAEGDIE